MGPVVASDARGPIAARALIRVGQVARRDPQLAVSVSMLVLVAAAILGAGFLTSASPYAQDVFHRLEPPSWVHPFGTDQLGRDVLARVLYGGRISVPAAVVVVLVGASVGTVLGMLAGYGDRTVDELVMRVTDVVLAFPVLVLAMAVSAALGASLINGIIALSAVWWPSYVRVCRGMILELRERQFVVAARAAGRSSLNVLSRVILPNVMPALLVMAFVDVGRAILDFSILSFLGLGIRPPAPEWGSMVASGVEVMDQWWVATFPGLAILLVIFAFNLLGDSVRDALDPWVSGRR